MIEVVERKNMDTELFSDINAKANGCMDGRGVILKLKLVDGKWQIMVPREKAETIVEAHLPGRIWDL